MQSGTANVIFQKPEGGFRPYGLVGMGVYYRPDQGHDARSRLRAGVCDPWWYYCVPGGWVPVENIIGDRSSTDFGMDFGGGVRFGKIYAGIRYHYIWGPKIEAETSATPIVTPSTTDSSRESKANGQSLSRRLSACASSASYFPVKK